jgi:DNA-binding NtrC family response regulator
VKTVPHRIATRPIGALAVEVVEGRDLGRGSTTSSDLLTIGSAAGNDVVLTDPTVSRFHAELARQSDGVLVTDTGSTNGTFAGAVSISRGVVPIGTILRLGQTLLRIADGGIATVDLLEEDSLAGLRGASPAMRRLLALIARIATSSASVLLIGESGTGKELAARALHQLGPRASGPLVAVDCGSVVPTLLASDLFGHERGAFTGAEERRTGAFEAAHGGTLFLDEIAELPASLQVHLLGALERRRFRRLGGSKEIAVDVRLVSATSRDLRADVNAGRFRLDLYFRLAVVPLRIPPLRERSEDIPLLVETFLRECGHQAPIDEVISPEVMASLAQHHWPGNVRELRNLVEATVALGEVPAPAAPAQLDAATDVIASVVSLPYKQARARVLEEFERRYLAHLLARKRDNVAAAARAAAMDRSHLTDLLARHGLSRRRR